MNIESQGMAMKTGCRQLLDQAAKARAAIPSVEMTPGGDPMEAMALHTAREVERMQAAAPYLAIASDLGCFDKGAMPPARGN